jgi:hypothetical protein
MLITQQQLRALQSVDSPSFVPYMQQHLQQYFAIARQAASPEGLLAFINTGIEKAKRHGFATRYEACLYIDVMAMLGLNFEKDPLLGWTTALLRPPVPLPTKEKINRLLAATYDYLDEVAGRNETAPIMAFEDLVDMPTLPFSKGTEQFDADAAHVALRNFWPSKYLNAGAGTMHYFIQTQTSVASQFGFSDAVSATYFLQLQMTFGHEFYASPLFSSLAAILQQPSTQWSEWERYQQLHDAVMGMLAPIVSAA